METQPSGDGGFYRHERHAGVLHNNKYYMFGGRGAGKTGRCNVRSPQLRYIVLGKLSPKVVLPFTLKTYFDALQR